MTQRPDVSGVRRGGKGCCPGRCGRLSHILVSNHAVPVAPQLRQSKISADSWQVVLGRRGWQHLLPLKHHFSACHSLTAWYCRTGHGLPPGRGKTKAEPKFSHGEGQEGLVPCLLPSQIYKCGVLLMFKECFLHISLDTLKAN